MVEGFNYVFGGDPVEPAQVAYKAFSITSDLSLQWPWSEQDTDEVVAVIIQVTPLFAGLSVLLPPANQASVGQPTLIRNVGSFAVTVRNAAADTLVTIDPGLAWYIYITDNTTLNGLWGQIQFGAGASSANAGALAGYGLQARTTFLDQNHPVTTIVTDLFVDATYRARVITVDPSIGTGVVDLDALANVGDGFFFLFSNLGSGAWTIDPDGSELIDNQSEISINPLESCEIHAGPSGWYTIGRGRNTTFAFTQNTQSVAGNADVVLSTSQAGAFIQDYFGALTGNINVIVPNAVQPYIVRNRTTGAFSLTVKTATGSGLTCEQGEQTWLYCNGTDVLDADSGSATTPTLSMPDGTEAAPGLSFTLEADTGFYRPGANSLGISVSATEIVELSPDGLEVTQGNVVVQGTDIRMLMTVLG